MCRHILISIICCIGSGVLADKVVIRGIEWTFSQTGGSTFIGNGRSPAISQQTSGTITVPDEIGGWPVDGIASYAFSECTNLSTIIIPNTIKSIGSRVFEKCRNLTSVQLPNGMQYISDNLFSQCINLKSIDIPSSVETIGSYAFYYCTGLTAIVLPEGIKSIGSDAFYSCSSLESISLPSSLTYIGFDAFGKCKTLSSIAIPSGVQTIGNRAFAECTSLHSVIFSDAHALESIGDSAFSGCSGIFNLIVPDSVSYIGQWAFSGVKNVEYNGSATGSPWSALSVNGFIEDSLVFSDETKTNLLGCDPLAYEAIIPSSVTNIGPSAFCACNNLQELFIPDSTVTIGSYAFSDCSKLCALRISKEVELLNSSVVAGSPLVLVRAIVRKGWNAIPQTWINKYPMFQDMYGTDIEKALKMKTGKKDRWGYDMYVWQDYIAGTDPTDITDSFVATIQIREGKPVVGWNPKLSVPMSSMREYVLLGKKTLSTDEEWTEVLPENEDEYRFFTVEVKMR